MEKTTNDVVNEELNEEMNNKEKEQQSELNPQSDEFEPIFDETGEFEVQSEDEGEECTLSIEELQKEIESLKQQLEDQENRSLRIQADFDNYKRRTRSEIEAIQKYRSQNLAVGILNAIDNFERALQTNATTEEGQSILQGMQMVYQQILDALKSEGVEPIESVGKPFDPQYHHAVMQDSSDEHESNIVLEEFQKGYVLKDKVIRHAMVKVNQ